MNSTKRTCEYEIGKSLRGRLTITLNHGESEIPFSVWRDVGLLAGLSYMEIPGTIVFEFFLPENLPKAEEILRGAMWVKKGRV